MCDKTFGNHYGSELTWENLHKQNKKESQLRYSVDDSREIIVIE